MNWLTYRKAVLQDRPVFYAPLDSTLSQRDLTNKSNNVAVLGTSTKPPGFFGGQALKFPGVNGNNGMDWGNQTHFNLSDVWSLESWFLPGGVAAQGANQDIISKGINGSSGAYGMLWNSTNSNIRAQKVDQADLASTAVGSVVAGVWYHLVATKNGSTTKLYINGKDVTIAGTNAVCANSSRGLGIGLHENSTGTGYISESLSTHSNAAVYSYALSPAQVLRHYHAGRFGHI
jgi:hypothetical protein